MEPGGAPANAQQAGPLPTVDRALEADRRGPREAPEAVAPSSITVFAADQGV